MKIIISTFNNSKNNYGALFQAHALSAFLNGMGYDAWNVTLERRENRNQSTLSRFKILVKKILQLPISGKLKTREKKLRQFAAQTQRQIVYPTREALFRNPPLADVYLSGSDQVWNPVSMHEDLFLAYAPEGSKKISYAASMGNEKIPSKNLEQFTRLIGEYASFSVREDTAAEVIRILTDKPVYQHVDPVFLKPRSEWEKLEHPYEKLKFRKYILAYIIGWNEELNRKLEQVKRETGLPVVSVNIGNIKNICVDQIIYDASPNEFLFLLHNCEMMVATSFHGVAMSIIYNKPFLPLTSKSMPTRIQSLLRHFQLDATQSMYFGELEFEGINRIIAADQEAARGYIRRCVENISS